MTETNPQGICFDSQYIWVCNCGSNSISQIQISTNTVTRTIQLAINTEPKYIISNNNLLWITCYNRSIIVIDKTSYNTINTISLPGRPYYICQDTTYVWANNIDANNVFRILKSNFTLTTITINISSSSIITDETYFYVGKYTILKYRISDNSLVSTLPNYSTFSQYLYIDNNYMYSSNILNNNVTVIDLNTFTVVTTVNVNSNPDGITSDNLNIYVANRGSNNISVINKVTNINSGSMLTQQFPISTIYTNNTLYITNLISNSVTYYIMIQAPIITIQPQSINVIEYYNVTLNVVAQSDTPLIYQWYSNTKNLNTGGKIIKNAINNKLTLKVSNSLLRYYYVIVSNDGGSVVSDVAKITIFEKSIFLLKRKNIFKLFYGIKK